MKKFVTLTAVLVVLSGTAQAQIAAPVTTTTSTTAQTPVGTVTTTTDVTTPAPAAVAPAAPVAAPIAPAPTARDAITGQPVDKNAAADANDDLSLRDKVRAKISDEAQVKQ